MTRSQIHKIALCALFSPALTSCGSFYYLPSDYSGPTAIIRGTSTQQNFFKGESFSVTEIDEKRVSNVSPVATPYGAGPGLTIREPEVKVMPKPMTVTLSANTIYAADGPALVYALAGGNRSVSGQVSFTPKAGGEYRVKGSLEKGAEAVWLVEEKTGKMVGQKITNQ